jgi:hypothetical protein
MDDRDLGIISAIILSGIVGGERTSADEKTIKRSIDIAIRLKILLQERIQGKLVSNPISAETPNA